MYEDTPPEVVNEAELAGTPYVVEIFVPPATVTAVGVAVIAVDESDVPTALTALIRIWYEVPLLNPEIVKGDEISVGDLDVQLDPLLDEN